MITVYLLVTFLLLYKAEDLQLWHHQTTDYKSILIWP